MSHYRSKVTFPTLLIGVMLLIVGGVIVTPFAFAQQTLVCPTPEPNSDGGLQLTYCYVITPTAPPTTPTNPITTAVPNLPTPTTSSIPVVEFPLPSGQPMPTPGTSTSGGGGTCQSDALAGYGCTCPSYQEADYLCVDANCAADGGLNMSGLGGLPGLPAGANCAFPPGKAPPDHVMHTCVTQCNSKPIVYLYPTKPTKVDVRIELDGRVTVSDPLYPQEGGWKNVLAHPDGTLFYQGKKYRELYYESETVEANPPTHGVFIPRDELKPQLETLTMQLGLNKFESDEFVEYWVSELEKLNKPYIFFSIFDPKEKARVDEVHISPKPDVFIEFLAYFKGVDAPYPVEPFRLPHVPERSGFTAVEWGGAIDR